MEIKSGDKLGPYEILARIGTGGMGEVWKARDPRLNRDVAIKFSAQQFTDRFEREARAIAALNHPNICTLFDVGPNYLVMELIDGPTLADRIAQGPVSLEEALTIAKQTADALEAAHEKGVVHRDLKPANIKIRPDGSVKVLDFGLAKAGGEQALTSDSPTMMPGTQVGMILGTAGYMSPEQARGQNVDKRADIWAFGVVLYEMLTGKRLFDGATVSDSLAAILTREPDLTQAPERTRRLLRRCLEKDPKKRLRDISGAELLLELVAEVPASHRRWLWMSAAAMALISGVALGFYFRGPGAANPEIRVDIMTPPTTAPASFALSPDGGKIAYVASGDGASRLWVRSLDSTSARPLPGTEGATNPFWAPDNRSLGFFADEKLKRIDLGEGQPQILAEAQSAGDEGAWNADGTILFHSLNITGPLLRLPASGGPAVVAVKPTKGQLGHRAPRFLPDGRQFLFTSSGAESAIWLGSLDGADPRRVTTIAPGTDSAGEYLAPGWLVRIRGNVLIAQHFDAGSGQISGDPIALAQSVGSANLTGSFSVSRSGGIAWRSIVGGRRQLIWFNRTGQNQGTFGAPDDFTLLFPELSPDGKRAAISRGPTGVSDLWMQESTRVSRLTFDPAGDRYAIWSPDGARLVFASNRKGVYDLFQKPANASASEEVLLQSADNKWPDSWSPDGRFILYYSAQNGGDLMVLPLTGDRKPYPFLSTPFNEQQGVFSPDGKWVAYQSNESGRNQVYVRPFPGPGGQWQVSTEGGTSPRWRADGKELYYLASDSKLMAVAVLAQGAAFTPGTPAALFQTRIPQSNNRPNYDVARDGRFLIATDLQDTSTEPIHLLLNWKPPK
jgi:Tol biopolymer transport system component/tRNA A-37 threonylcarbamoyl transferase component Bud32